MVAAWVAVSLMSIGIATGLKTPPTLCPAGAIVLKVDQISMGMNATSTQVRNAFKGLTTSLRAPFVYAIASLKQAEVERGQRNVALSLMIGGVTLVLRKPPKQAVGLAPCKGSKETIKALTNANVPVRVRRDLQWAQAVWYNNSAPVVYVCRDPTCRPLGANDLLPERRVFSDDKVYTKRKFLAEFAAQNAQESDWRKGTVVPYNKSEEIKKTQLAPINMLKASQTTALGLLQAKEVLVDYDTRHVSADSLMSLVSAKSVFPLPGTIQDGGKVSCKEGCRLTFPKGPDLVLTPREFPDESSRKGHLRAVVWHTQDLEKVKNALQRRDLLGGPIKQKKYAKCIKMSLEKFGVTSHTGLWFCQAHNPIKRATEEVPVPTE